jgi:hypothetical protein
VNVAPRPGWEVVIVAASGPSFDPAQAGEIEQLRAARACRVIAVNDTWRLLPSADLLYACDGEWWTIHGAEVRRARPDLERWTQSADAVQRFGLTFIKVDAYASGLTKRSDTLHGGGGSGYQAVNLAYLLGARRIALVGFDMQPARDGRQNFFGSHPPGLRTAHPYQRWIREFDALARDLEAAGVDLVNCTKTTALQRVRRSTLAECFGETVPSEEA